MAGITEQDIEHDIPEDELLALPADAFVPGALTAIWAKRATLVEQRMTQEIALELSPEYSGPRRLTVAPDKKSEAERIATRQRQFLQTMEDIRERSDRLLEKIVFEEEVSRRRLEDIDRRAITLRDGRKAYVGADGDYRDGQGAVLAGPAAEEAHRLHGQNPSASTWAEKFDAENQHQALIRLKEKTQKLHDEAGSLNGEKMSADQGEGASKSYADHLSGYEKEFKDGFENRTAGISTQQDVTDESYGGSDYMDAYARPDAGRTPSFAGRIDGDLPPTTLNKDFALAAAGQGTEPVVDTMPKPASAKPDEHQTLSR